MARQTFIWTVLPHGRETTPGGSMLKLSLYLSPRLYADSEVKKTLNDYQDLLHLTTTVRDSCQFRIHIDGLPPVEPAAVQRDASVINPALWESMFSKETPVTPYVYEKYEVRPIMSFPVKNIEAFLKEEYSEVGLNNPETFPGASDLRDKLKEINLLEQGITGGMQKPMQGGNGGGVSRQAMLSRMPNLGVRVRQALEKGLDALVGTRMELTTNAADALGDIMRELNQKQYVTNQGASPAKDFLQFALFHAPQNKKSKPGSKTALGPHERLKITIPTPDFHEVVSSLGDYAELSRMVGLIIDLKFPVPAGLPTTGRIRVEPIFATPFKVATTHFCPKTVFTGAGEAFQAQPKAGNAELQGGLLNLSNSANFDVVMLDVNGGAFKLMHLADTAARCAPPAPPPPMMLADASGQAVGGQFQLAAAASNVLDKMQNLSLPALRSAGISVVHRKRAQQLHDELMIFAEINTAMATHEKTLTMTASSDDKILYAEDLVRGYRVDVWDSRTGKWHSLCKRKGTYTFKKTPGLVKEITDEGMCTTGLTEPVDGSSQELRLPESLFTWDGWSLVAPRPGKTIDEHDHPVTYENLSYTPSGLVTQFEPEANTLPRLRFGVSYRIRARVADLAGNGLRLEDFADDNFTGATGEHAYLRYEPAGSPAIVLTAKVKPGESLERVVVRSNYDATPQEYTQLHQISDLPVERHVAAPKASVTLAETHSRLDAMTPHDSYVLITTRDGSFAPLPKDSEPEYNYEAAIHPETTIQIPYLPDPAARGAALAFFDRHNKPIGSLLLKDFYPGGTAWPNPVSFKLRLIEGSGEPAWDSANPDVLVVPVPKAERVTMRLSCALADDILESMGVWNWMKERDASKTATMEELAVKGRHWMLTPYREISFMHAVQQPLVEPKFEALHPVKTPGATVAILNGHITFDGLSSGRVDIRGEWTEPVDDISQKEPGTINGAAHVCEFNTGEDEKDLRFGDQTVGPQQIADVNATVAPGALEAAAGLSGPSALENHSLPAQQEKTIVQNPGLINTQKTGSQTQSTQTQLIQHSAGLVSHVGALQIVKRVFPFNSDRDAQRHEFGDTRFRRVRYTAVATTRFRENFLDLLGSHQLAVQPLKGEKPEPLPLTRESTKEVLVLNSARPLVPKVLYVIPTFQWERKEDTQSVISRRCGGGLRVYMERPWYSSGDEEMLGVILHSAPAILEDSEPLKSFVTQWGIDPTWKSSGSLTSAPSLSAFKEAAKKASGISLHELQRSVSVAGHAVHFDTDRHLWFSDIVIDAGSSYFPFVRLALARYQPNSIPGAHISPVVTTDFVQLPPDRVAAVILNKDRTLTVQVAGVYGVKISEPTEQHLNSLPRSRYVVAWLERRIAGDDLGWMPVRPADQAKQYMTAAEQQGAKVRWETALPAHAQLTALGTRQFRVVVQEYEILAAEGGKGDRLVYADAIEL